jgi:hypothetical protein
MLEGPLHGVLTRSYDTGPADAPVWVSHDLTPYSGHRVHIEFGPDGDAPLEILQVMESETAPAAAPVDPLPVTLAKARTAKEFAEALEAQGSSREKFDADNREAAEKAVKTQLLMDAISDDLDIQVGENDLSERLVLMSRQYGVEPQQLVQLLQQNNQLPAIFADVRRGLAVAAVVEAATVTDTDGNVIDTTEFFGPPAGPDSEPDDQPADADE